MKRNLQILFTVLISAFLLSCAAPVVKQEGPSVFYPALPQTPRIQFLKSIMLEEDLERKQSKFDEFLLGEQPITKRIGRPIDIGTVKGKVYISDRLHKKILFIDLNKNEFDYIRDEGIGDIREPAGLWVTEDDMKYIADMGRKQVLVFDDKNEFANAYGEVDQFERPVDVAVDGNRIYVCDLKKNKIVVLDKNSGKTIQEIGEIGKGEGKFYKPSYLTLDHEGNLFVTDSFNFRVQMFDASGKFVKVIGFHGDNLGAFSRPKGTAVDRENHLYAIDAAFENIQIFDIETSKLLLFFGGHGNNPGNMHLPAGVYIGHNNIDYFQKFADKNFKIEYLIYVGNLIGTERLGVYGFGKWVGPPLPGMERKEIKE